MKNHGTRIIIYNLWEDDEGMLELDFDTDPHVCVFIAVYIHRLWWSWTTQKLLYRYNWHMVLLQDIQLRGVNRDEKNIKMASEFPNSRHFLTYRHSLRVKIFYWRCFIFYNLVWFSLRPLSLRWFLKDWNRETRWWLGIKRLILNDYESYLKLAAFVFFCPQSYVSILYLRVPPEFRIILRGRDVEHHNLVNDMMQTEKITYRPKEAADGSPSPSNVCFS